MAQVIVTTEIPGVDCVSGDDGLFICEIESISETSQSVISIFGLIYKYILYAAPFLLLFFILGFAFTLYKIIRCKEDRKKWIFTAVILFLLNLLAIILLAIDHYATILAPWIFQ